MTQINAKIIADSKNEFGNRITTMVVTFPRYILAELNTHRMLSKNSASSRAIPFEKMVKSVGENPFIPIAWMKDHKGMQGTEYFDLAVANDMKDQWLAARDVAINKAKVLFQYGLTKQLCNRLLEPFMWHTVIITATEWENFFALRCPKYTLTESTLGIGEQYRSKKYAIKSAKNMNIYPKIDIWSDLDWLKMNNGQADIHMMALAEAMWDAYNESTPKELKSGQWHIPFGDTLITNGNDDLYKLYGDHPNEDNISIKIATARCARISYTVVGEENKPANYENDIKLHDRLLTSGHMSPFEHCARVPFPNEMSDLRNGIKVEGITNSYEGNWSGNFQGFIQYRKTLPNENIKK